MLGAKFQADILSQAKAEKERAMTSIRTNDERLLADKFDAFKPVPWQAVSDWNDPISKFPKGFA